jgi:pyridoxal phosphate enzyme (YggS family)
VNLAISMVVAQEIAGRIQRVQEAIATAASRAGRSDPVLLVAVTKGQSTEYVRAAYAAGLRDFGESRVEEAGPKIDELSDLPNLHWHLIGHVQSRKADRASGKFDLIHSVDRPKIARLLEARAAEVGRRQPILLECNVSGEESKAGWPMSQSEVWGEHLGEIEEVVGFEDLEVRGLMTIAPMTDDKDGVRSVFRRLRQLRDFLAERLSGDWPELSMGMTDDFELAIEEGATIVRIGRAIFGERSGDRP